MNKKIQIGILALSLVTLSSIFTSARAEDPAWTCYAQGKQSFGGPVGDIWQTVLGQGATELEATDNAQQNCMSQGLEMCMVQSCSQR